MKRARRVAIALMVAFLPVSGGIGAQAEDHSLVLAIGGEEEAGYDPIQGWGAYGHPLFQSTLLRLDADLKVVGDLATQWKLSEDRLIWTIRIRNDARFSDGAPVTAEDVAFTFETAKDAGGLADLTVLDRAEVVDEHTVALHLAEPRITFMRQLQTLGIVPADGYSEGYGRDPVGSGPYRLVEWREGEQLTVEPNPHWHGGALPFDRITFLFAGEDAAFAMAASGEVDVASVPPALARTQLDGMKLLEVPSVDNRGISFPVVPEEGRRTEEGVPIGNDVTSDPAIRKAINMALDREALVQLALDGHGTPASGPADGLPWGNAEAALPSPDIEGAAELLEQAGWTSRDDGVRTKDGLPARFTLVYPTSDTTRQALAIGVSEQLRRLGIDVELSGLAWSEIGKRAHADAVMFGWGAHDPQEIWNLYHSSRAGKGYFNPGFYSNPVVDAHFKTAQRSENLEASLRHWKAAAWDGTTGFGARGDAAWAWLVNLKHTYFVDECLDLGPLQVEPHGHGWPLTAGIENWRWTCE